MSKRLDTSQADPRKTTGGTTGTSTKKSTKDGTETAANTSPGSENKTATSGPRSATSGGGETKPTATKTATATARSQSSDGPRTSNENLPTDDGVNGKTETLQSEERTNAGAGEESDKSDVGGSDDKQEDVVSQTAKDSTSDNSSSPAEALEVQANDGKTETPELPAASAPPPTAEEGEDGEGAPESPEPIATAECSLSADSCACAQISSPYANKPYSEPTWTRRCMLCGVVVILVLAIAVAAAWTRVHVHKNVVPEYRWTHNLKAAALISPVTFLVVAGFVLYQQYEIYQARETLRRYKLFGKYSLVIASFLAGLGMLATKYYFKKVLPELEREDLTVTMRLLMYVILAIGASSLAKVVNNVLGHPYRRGGRRRREMES